LSPLSIYPVKGLPEIRKGDPLGEFLAHGLFRLRMIPNPKDIVVITQKIVSKAEGRTIDLNTVKPSARASEIAGRIQYEPAHVEVILQESVRIVREAPRVLITETKHGFVCANAGVDRSNTGAPNLVVLLPEDPDGTAAKLRREIGAFTGVEPGVIISDSFGRPWREGQVNVAIGAAGLTVMRDYRGDHDPSDYELQGTMLAVVDEVASAAELVMGKLDRVPAALVRGIDLRGEQSVKDLLRDPKTDLFR
jgi:coenzyme F420-0:L-glutamate ligase/coenzyme F420-1:gamma-L-glutamate ligase